MRTPMLKRRLNPFLLASIVLVLSLLAGLSVLYQGTLNEEIDEKKNLQEKINQQNSTITGLRQEKSRLQNSLSKVEDNLDNKTFQIQNLETEVSNLESTISELQTDIEQLNTQIDGLQSDVSNLNSSLEYICSVSWDNMTDGSRDECRDRGHNYES